MKTTLCMLLFAAVSTTASIAQKNTQPIPQQVAMHFSKKFNNIEQVEWRAADNNKYEAQFNENGKAKKVVYSNAGQWLAIESPASQQEFPQAVNKSLSQNFAGYQVAQATRMELFGKGVAFRIRIRKGNGSMDVEIDTNGNVRRRIEVYEEHRHHDDCHHHHDDCHHHSHCDHHKHKDKHKHKHGKGHKHHHDHDDDDD
jgi:hypothetical protein